MITHFVFIRLAPPHADAAGRAAVVALARAVDASVATGVPADDSAAKWDVSIVVTAATLDHLAALRAAAAWRALDDHLAAHAIVVKAWNFVAA